MSSFRLPLVGAFAADSLREADPCGQCTPRSPRRAKRAWEPGVDRRLDASGWFCVWI